MLPVGEIDKQDAICCPSVVKTVIRDALCPISQCGSVSSRHWLTNGRRCGVRKLLSNFDDVAFVSLYCQTSSFRPCTAHTHPLLEQFIDTDVFRSLNVSASFTVMGNGSPND